GSQLGSSDALSCVHRMMSRVQLHRRAKFDIVSNLDHGAVEEDTVEVRVDAVAEADVDSIIAKERRLDPDLGAAVAKQAAQQLITFGKFILTGLVVSGEKLASPPPQREQFRVGRDVGVSA